MSAATLFSGCVLKYPVERNSRFAVDISEMRKAEFMHDTWVYRHPSKRVRDYPAYWVSSVQVFPKPVKRISKAMRKRYELLAGRLDGQLKGLIHQNFAEATGPGENVLELKIAIIDMKPIVRTQRDGNDVILTDTLSKGSKFELDAVDSKSGELIFAISTLLKGDNFAAIKDPALIPVLEKEFTSWLDFLVESLKKAKAEAADAEPQ
jgi:hypothetical protein